VPIDIELDGSAIGIELDDSCIGMELWPLAVDECPEEQAATSSASAPAMTAALNPEPGRKRPGDADLYMDRPPRSRAVRETTPSEDGFEDAC
jgi:hypothetical protein